MRKIVFFTLSLLFSFAACAPATDPVPTSTPVGYVAPAVEVVDKFYKAINEAQTEADLLVPFNMLTTIAMCNYRIVPYCDATMFQTKWWKLKVTYKLYDCGNNDVISEEMLYPRSDSSPSTPAAPKFWRYELVQNEEGGLINDITATQTPGEGCVLALDSTTQP